MKKNIALSLLFILSITIGINAQTYNYYFGNIHAHTSYSDGNQDSATSNMTKPLQAFNYAKNAQHIDFYGISEHNHYTAGMTNTLNYYQGMADANAATTSSFVALYGMEWGVISGGGHVIVYGYDSLLGWDNFGYDVYVAQNDYVNLFKKINEQPTAFAYLAHPAAGDYNNLFNTAVNLNADNAIVGLAARSGPAASTNSTYSNPSTSNFIGRYNDALKRGYHLGVGLDHDTHNSVFGKQTAGRLVVLAPSLTRADILDAIRQMRFYSSDDWNTKVNFTIKNNPMGSMLSYTGTPTLVASVTDADVSETVSSIAVYYGVPGSGANPTVLTTVTNTSNLSYTHNMANNSTYYYYLKITQADGNIIWTSPIWYTRNDALTNTPPVANFTASSSTVCAGQTLTFTDNTTNGPSAWNWSLPGAMPSTSNLQHVIAKFRTAGVYTISLNASNAFGTSATQTQIITVVPLPTLIVDQDTICSGQSDTIRVSGASAYSWNTGQTTGTRVVSPTSTFNAVVTGTLNGCSNYKVVFIAVESCVGIEELVKNHFLLYPNPASNFLTIDFKELVNEKKIEVYDEFGKLLLVQKTTEPILQIPVDDFKNGIYFIKIVLDDKHITTQKFVVDRE
ncbi:MAG: T9SS type A sorting domain-containing protein [Bacteroidetes bacterium]|nr:T9SS type A sorting domain-containing protein [Bacteroidota bacterium]